MAGIAGFLNYFPTNSVTSDILRQFEAVQQVQEVHYQKEQYQSPHCVLLNLSTGLLRQPRTYAVHGATQTVLMLEGEVYNLDGLGVEGMGNERCAVDVLLDCFLKYGDNFITRLNGEFNIVAYEQNAERLLLFSDHAASRPMYYRQSGNGLYFASEKKAILAAAKEPLSLDEIGLLQIVAHRHNLEDRTFIREIKRLTPGSCLLFDRQGLSVSRYHLFSTEHIASTDVHGLAAQWEEQLCRATTTRLNGRERVLISLSGGLDSRAIACAIPRDFRPIVSRTRGYENSWEAILAGSIAERLGFDHFREEPTTVPYSTLVPKIVWRTEGETHFTNGISLANHRQIKEGGDFIVGGWYGDVSSGSHIYPYMLQPRSREDFLARAYRWNMASMASQLPSVFTQPFLNAFLPRLEDAFYESFSYLSGSNIQIHEIWDIYQRQARMTTSSMPVDSYLFEKIRPFVDKEYLEFTFTIPTRLRLGQSLYQKLIYSLGPEIRDVPNSNSLLMLKGTLGGNLQNEGRVLLRKARSRLLRRVNPRYRNRVEAGVNDNQGEEIRRDANFQIVIDNFVHSAECDPAVFNRTGILTLLEEHYAGQADHAYLLGYIATFAYSLPYFLNSRTTSCPAEAQPLDRAS